MRPKIVFSRFAFTKELEAETERLAQETLDEWRGRKVGSAFPRAIALMTRPGFREGLGAAMKRAPDGYRTCEDMLLCELIPAYKEACQAYYEEAGGQIAGVASQEDLRQCERVLFCALALGNELFKEFYPDLDIVDIAWNDFVETVRRSFALQDFPSFSTAAAH